MDGQPRGETWSLDPAAVVIGRDYAVGPEPVFFDPHNPDQWSPSGARFGDVIEAAAVDQHGNVTSAATGNLVHSRHLASLDNIALMQKWGRQRGRSSKPREPRSVRSWLHRPSSVQMAASGPPV